MTTSTDTTDTTGLVASKQDGFGYTNNENMIYKRIKAEAIKYFLQVTKELQQNINKQPQP
jgi:hypothetical protein